MPGRQELDLRRVRRRSRGAHERARLGAHALSEQRCRGRRLNEARSRFLRLVKPRPCGRGVCEILDSVSFVEPRREFMKTGFADLGF